MGIMRRLTHKGTQTIETKRLILRRFKPGDAKFMFKNWASDSKVFKFFKRNAHSDLSQTEEIVNYWVEEYINPDCYNWAIELKSSGEIVGQISLVDLNEKCCSCEVGCIIGRPFWDKGISTEALKAVIHYLFKRVGMNRIEGRHHTQNTASGMVMQKCGMSFEGIMRQADVCKNEQFCDLAVYAILKSDLQL